VGHVYTRGKRGSSTREEPGLYCKNFRFAFIYYKTGQGAEMSSAVGRASGADQ
jgi:hypothetical protein